MKNPKNDCVLPLCGDHVPHVLLRLCGFRLPLGVKCLGKRDLYLPRGDCDYISSGVNLYG